MPALRVAMSARAAACSWPGLPGFLGRGEGGASDRGGLRAGGGVGGRGAAGFPGFLRRGELGCCGHLRLSKPPGTIALAV